ncbi:hypothetical protein DICVIV_02944 [Dictyocaulus viviparus]|uniref:Uncharacterized protein n=1 Tax=Dictyocaulus viviparus TaxID=29172 RepID=A0A0D8Y2F8_DICVI|nr:hypothetical protein DICVIV_02944 [Dictyocaulus viviparus]
MMLQRNDVRDISQLDIAHVGRVVTIPPQSAKNAVSVNVCLITKPKYIIITEYSNCSKVILKIFIALYLGTVARKLKIYLCLYFYLNYLYVDKTKSDCSCLVCNRNCAYVEINRSLRPELQVLFRNPRELATQYMRNLSQVLEFQGTNRSRFFKHIAEKEKKATKFAHLARDEIKRRIDKAVEEHARLKCELDMERMRCRDLEARLTENEKTIEELQKNFCGLQPPIARSDSGIDAEMESDSGLSFLNVATSTPIRSCSELRAIQPKNRFTSTGHRNRNHISEMFLASSDNAPSPITLSTDHGLTTPAMLGLKHSVSRGSNSSGRLHSSNKRFEFQSTVAQARKGF